MLNFYCCLELLLLFILTVYLYRFHTFLSLKMNSLLKGSLCLHPIQMELWFPILQGLPVVSYPLYFKMGSKWAWLLFIKLLPISILHLWAAGLESFISNTRFIRSSSRDPDSRWKKPECPGKAKVHLHGNCVRYDHLDRFLMYTFSWFYMRTKSAKLLPFTNMFLSTKCVMCWQISKIFCVYCSR